MIRKYNLPPHVKVERGLYYFRRRGHDRVRLSGVPWSPEFMAQLHDAMAGKSGDPRLLPGSFGEALVAYLAAPAFLARKGASTVDVDRRRLEAIGAKHGELPLRLLHAAAIEKILATKATAPHEQRSVHRVLRCFLDYAVSRKLIKTNPAREVKLPGIKTIGFHNVTDEEIAQFEAKFPIGTKARLAFA